MAKIGTAHVEIKPVLNEDAMRAIEERVAEAVRAGVKAGLTSNALTAGPFRDERLHLLDDVAAELGVDL